MQLRLSLTHWKQKRKFPVTEKNDFILFLYVCKYPKGLSPSPFPLKFSTTTTTSPVFFFKLFRRRGKLLNPYYCQAVETWKPLLISCRSPRNLPSAHLPWIVKKVNLDWVLLWRGGVSVKKSIVVPNFAPLKIRIYIGIVTINASIFRFCFQNLCSSFFL